MIVTLGLTLEHERTEFLAIPDWKTTESWVCRRHDVAMDGWGLGSQRGEVDTGTGNGTGGAPRGRVAR